MLPKSILTGLFQQSAYGIDKQCKCENSAKGALINNNLEKHMKRGNHQ